MNINCNNWTVVSQWLPLSGLSLKYFSVTALGEIFSSGSHVHLLRRRFCHLIKNSFCPLLTRCPLIFCVKYTLLGDCSVDSFLSKIFIVLSSNVDRYVAAWPLLLFWDNLFFSTLSVTWSFSISSLFSWLGNTDFVVPKNIVSSWWVFLGTSPVDFSSKD